MYYTSEPSVESTEKSIITSIIDSSGNITQNPSIINDSFRSCYSNVYTPGQNTSPKEAETFLKNVSLPKLTQTQSENQEVPLSLEEFTRALHLMPNNKSPGPDGYPAEFYKQLWPLLSPLFFKVISEIHQNTTIPHHMNTAYITLIPKPNNDPTQCSNYCPISLINRGTKILSNALSVKLESVISSLIHIDQTGFIKGRRSSENTQRLFNLFNFYKNSTSPNNPPFIIASLDAEKAFDRVDWSFLFTSLNHFGFRPYFTNWIKTLYSSPTAHVITNGLISKPFQLQRGTRQGCPLSPLLFALFIEPLAASIRQCARISGIQSKSHHQSVCR